MQKVILPSSTVLELTDLQGCTLHFALPTPEESNSNTIAAFPDINAKACLTQVYFYLTT